MLFEKKPRAAKPPQSAKLFKSIRRRRDGDSQAAAMQSNAIRPLLLLPNELLLYIIQLLTPTGCRLFTSTCSRLRALAPLNPLPKDQAMSTAKTVSQVLLADDTQQVLGPEWAICFECFRAHTRDAFFPEQLAMPMQQRCCKLAGILCMPDGTSSNYWAMRIFMGTPDTARQQWLSRGACNTVSRHDGKDTGRMHYVYWRICRDDSGHASLTNTYFTSLNYTPEARRPTSHGPFKRWRQRHNWGCMLQVVYLYSDVSREDLEAQTKGGVDLREKRKRCVPQSVCPHLMTDSDEILDLSTFHDGDPSAGQCSACDTSFTLEALDGTLYLLIDRDLGSIDEVDPLKNTKWLNQIAPVGGSTRTASARGASLNPSRYEAARQEMRQTMTQTLNRH